jgi:acyl-coenzyme A synthetase/AMP-(fatty) acid ligase
VRDADGYYWFLGRADVVIKGAGYRIRLFEVESALIEHPAVLEAAVVGKPDAVRGQVVKAFVVLRRDRVPGEELKLELQNHCKRVTAPYKYPREIEFVAELPKTISGKIRRVELRRRA